MSKNKQITIYDLLPVLRKGWVAMDNNGDWFWYAKRPKAIKDAGEWYCGESENTELSQLVAFNISRFDGDWKDSLMKCGNNKKIITSGDQNDN